MFENEKEYNLKQNELLKLYLPTNTYCINCINIEDLNTVKLISKNSLNIAPVDCFGCSDIDEYELLAKEKGNDTLKYVRSFPLTEDCSDALKSKKVEQIIIRVR
jgi:hypothetical protein